MKQELQKTLFEKYPEFFEYLKNEEPLIRPMEFGFECGDGWYTIIEGLMRSIQTYIQTEKKDIAIDLLQVKEKFGGLRFYIYEGDDYINELIRLTEELSYETCEFCGTTNNIGRTRGWIFTICKECFDAGKTNQTVWKPLAEKN